jgi:hypothetical protein
MEILGNVGVDILKKNKPLIWGFLCLFIFIVYENKNNERAEREVIFFA